MVPFKALKWLFNMTLRGENHWRRSEQPSSEKAPVQLNLTLLVSCCPPTGRKRAGGEEGAKGAVLKDCGRSSVSDWQALSLRISSGLCWWNNRRGT